MNYQSVGKCILILVLTTALFTSCKTQTSQNQTVELEETKNNMLVLEGIIQKQGITTYQYGTHILKTGKQLYALRSETVKINQFINKKVSVRGEKIEGYPIEGGPEYILVKSIKLIGE